MAIDNNPIKRQIKPWKLGAKNWLFPGSTLARQRAAVVMSHCVFRAIPDAIPL